MIGVQSITTISLQQYERNFD